MGSKPHELSLAGRGSEQQTGTKNGGGLPQRLPDASGEKGGHADRRLYGVHRPDRQGDGGPGLDQGAPGRSPAVTPSIGRLPAKAGAFFSRRHPSRDTGLTPLDSSF